MDSMDVNKSVAALLVAGIVFFLAGWLGDTLVHPTPLAKTAIAIEGAATAAAGPAKPAPLPPIAPLLATADPVAGEADVKKLCAVCHTFNEGGKPLIGPNLYGIVGAPHGHEEGFNYSAGLKGLQGPWTFDELNEWLRNPRNVVPGTRMTFVGISSDKQRADVIDYLHTLSHNPEPLPSPTAAAPAAAPAAAAGGAVPPAAAAPAPVTAPAPKKP